MTEHDASELPQLPEDLKPPAEEATWRQRLSKTLRFVTLALRKTRADELTQRSAALAFITFVALVPLLTAFSYVGARAFSEQQQQELMVDLLTQILPYSEDQILDNLNQILEQSKKVRGFGFVFFLLTSMAAFISIDRTINQIWNVPTRRPLRTHLLSLTMVLFWGSLIIGAASWSFIYLRQQETFQYVAHWLPVAVLPFVVTLVGLTMLYWQVPYTTVQFRSAALGGLIAAVLLEALRQGFGLYVDLVRAMSSIYTGAGLVLLFMISIDVAWWIVLVGSEAAYCIQHHPLMLRPRRPAAALEGSWLGIAALAVISDRFRAGEPITGHELLAERLQIPAEELIEVLRPLVKNGLLREASGEAEGYMLSCDPHDLLLTRVFEQYEDAHRELLASLPAGAATSLAQLRAKLAEARDRKTDRLVVAKLVKPARP